MKAGWLVTTLGEAFITSTGSTPPKSNSDFYGQFMPLVKPPELCGSTLDSAEDGLSESGAQVARTLPPNSILVSCIGNLGKIGMNTVPVAFNQQINAIHPDTGKAVPEFMFFQTLGGRFREQLEAMASGTTVPIVNKSKFNSIEIVLPPLPEQQRIVTLLDKAFEDIATATANAEKNLQNARAIFESHLQSMFTQRGGGWLEKSLGDSFKTATGTTPPKNNSDFYGNFIPLAKPPELCNAPFDTAPDGLSEAGAEVARTLPAKSILVSCIGNLGKIGMNTVPVAFNQQINAILPDERLAIPEFMFFQALSPIFKDQLESMASGTTVPIVNKSKFNGLRIVLPPLTAQEKTVGQLETLRDETQRLEAIYKQKLTALDDLKKSLLHRAFNGDL
ncbi:MAG: type I restriction endonuclease [Comamonadaceae bacterium CG_4_9_14_0_8_um_filter_57_21]|nr:MAG: type I restriction endonuclease [Comamonadaceae bacterium CG_4_10_14_0_8_um_filter_57_29]PJC18886.1 MAG: type I restriction endonuclease [Comamonadaceae bacterium CG_4_9_14_0_8_um_filter_57_21]